jgi:hypothetical protein
MIADNEFAELSGHVDTTIIRSVLGFVVFSLSYAGLYCCLDSTFTFWVSTLFGAMACCAFFRFPDNIWPFDKCSQANSTKAHVVAAGDWAGVLWQIPLTRR